MTTALITATDGMTQRGQEKSALPHLRCVTRDTTPGRRRSRPIPGLPRRLADVVRKVSATPLGSLRRHLHPGRFSLLVVVLIVLKVDFREGTAVGDGISHRSFLSLSRQTQKMGNNPLNARSARKNQNGGIAELTRARPFVSTSRDQLLETPRTRQSMTINGNFPTSAGILRLLNHV